MSEPNSPPSAPFVHCQSVFEKMQANAEEEIITKYGQDGARVSTPTGFRVWVGYTTQLFQELELAAPYYTSTMRLLKAMGCVEQLQRGGGNAKSKWRIITEPTEDAFAVAAKLKRAGNGMTASLQQQLNDMQRRLVVVEKMLQVSNAAD
jgi:hypothetical protein